MSFSIIGLSSTHYNFFLEDPESNDSNFIISCSPHIMGNALKQCNAHEMERTMFVIESLVVKRMEEDNKRQGNTGPSRGWIRINCSIVVKLP